MNIKKRLQELIPGYNSFDRHTTYHEILDAVRENGGCPLCKLEGDSVRRYLDSVLYEGVNDPDTRDNLMRSRGYCKQHTRMLANMGNALGITIIYIDQMKSFLHFLDDIRESHSKRTKKLYNWHREERCPACEVRSESSRRYVSTLAGGLDEEEMCSAYSVSSGLCIPHFLTILGEIKDPDTFRYIVDQQKTSAVNLHDDLEEFYRKHDYRFNKEGFGRESDAWLRAIKMIAGEN